MSPPDCFDRPTILAYSVTSLCTYSHDKFRKEALRRHPAAVESTIRAAYDDLPSQPSAARVEDAYACVERATPPPSSTRRRAPPLVPRLDDKYDEDTLSWGLAVG
jgi:hypothetical protein